MIEVNIYLLSAADQNTINNINRTKPHGPQIIICDYGKGSCVEQSVIEDSTYLQWYNELDSILPFSSRNTETCTLENIN